MSDAARTSRRNGAQTVRLASRIAEILRKSARRTILEDNVRFGIWPLTRQFKVRGSYLAFPTSEFDRLVREAVSAALQEGGLQVAASTIETLTPFVRTALSELGFTESQIAAVAPRIAGLREDDAIATAVELRRERQL